MIRQQPWFRELVAVGWPITFYWVGVLLSLAVFCGSVFVTTDFNSEDVVALSTICVATVFGVLFGQLASLTRLRSTLFQTTMVVGFFIAIYVLVSLESVLKPLVGEFVLIVAVLGGMIGTIMASGGFWSLRVNRGLFAFWGPTMLATGSIIMVSQHYDNDLAWRAGQKYAIWSAGTAAILLGSVCLQVLFMAARERHRLHRWISAPQAAELVQQRPDPIRPLAGVGTWVLLGLLVLCLTFASAIVAPYLWRTGPGDEPGDHLDPDEPGDEPIDGPGLPDLSGVGQRVQQMVSMLCTLLTMLVLSVAALLIFGLPTRRQILLTHLRNPLWPVSASRRALLHWRLAEIAMGDAGVHRQPGETALEAAQRTVVLFPDVNLEALTTAAEISDRVSYGYTLDPTDADTIRRAAEMTYQAVWDTLGELDRLKNTYRPL